MDEAHPPSSHDWRLPDRARPPLVSELVERIDEAVAIARASESAVITVGAAALDAAEQAKRAADLAERASASIDAAVSPPAAGRRLGLALTTEPAMGDFDARADRVAERLRRLQRLPLSV